MEKRCSRKLFVIAVLCLLLNMAMTIHVAAETVSANEVKAERVSQETSGGEAEILYSGMSGDLEWTIDENGLLTITGEMDPYCGRYSGWLEYRDSIITAKVSVVGTEDLMNKMFWGCEKLGKVDFTGSDTSTVTDISCMFYDCYNLKSVDLSAFNTENVTDMSCLFWECNSLEEIKWGTNFKTGKVTDMSYMFYGCKSLEELDLSFFDTKAVEKMDNMFSYCSALKKLNIGTFNTDKVTDMSFMFWYCENLCDIDVTGFNTSKVTTMLGMFGYCGFEEIDVGNFDTSSLTNMQGMFERCKNLKKADLSKFKTENVTNMSHVFNECAKLEQVDLSSFKTSNVTDMSYMFYGCKNLARLDLSCFKTNKLESMKHMFNGCEKIQYINIKNFDVTMVTDINYNVFYGCNSLQTVVAPENKSYGTLMLPETDGFIWTYEPTGKKVWYVTSAGTYVKVKEGGTETIVTKKVEAVGTKLSSEKLTTTSGKIPANSTFTVTSSDSKNPTVSFDGVKRVNAAAVSIPSTVIYNGITYKVTSVSITSFTSTKDKAKYKVTGKKIGSLTVEYKAPTSKTGKTAKVSDYTVYKGIKFKVTSVATSAFKNNKKLTTVTIGKNVKKIGKTAFYGCKKLKTIKINSKVLKSVGKNALKGVNKNCKIKVPKAKLKAYKKLFKNKGQAKTVKIIKN